MEGHPETQLLVIRPLPPSVNRAWSGQTNARGGMKHTSDYNSWIDATSWDVKSFTMRTGIKNIDYYRPIYLYFFLSSNAADSHNYKKALLDALERGGLFKNDKYILDRTMAVEIVGNQDPRIEIYV